MNRRRSIGSVAAGRRHSCRTSDLIGELIAAQADLGTDNVLTKFGVPPDVTPIAGLARIRTNGVFYQPDPDGQPFVILPAFDGGEVADLLAFQPHRPASFKIRTGAVPLLGIDNMRTDFAPLRVWRSPLGYLRAQLEGVVVISWAGARPLLACCRKIVAEDVPHGREIREQLSRLPALPEISVPISAVQR